MPIDRLQELENRLRHFVVLDVTSAQFVGNIDGHIAAPTFGNIEGDNADRIFILAVEQISDQRRAVLAAAFRQPSGPFKQHPLGLRL